VKIKLFLSAVLLPNRYDSVRFCCVQTGGMLWCCGGEACQRSKWRECVRNVDWRSHQFLGIHVWSANITVETHQQTYEQFWSNIAPRMVRTVHDWGFHKFLLHNKLDRQCCTVAFADINL